MKIKSKKQYIAYGFHTVMSILKYQPNRALKIFLARSKDQEEILRLAREKNIPTEFTERVNIEKKFNVSSEAQGIVLVCHPPIIKTDDELLNKDPKLLIILDSLQDSANIGRIARSGVAFGADGLVICKDKSAPINALVEKASVGAVSRIDIAKIGNLATFLKKLKEHNFFIYGADERGGVCLEKADFAQKVAIVIGQEGKGLRDLTKKNCDLLIKIPMKEKDICLNAADAALLFLYKISQLR